MQPDGAEVRRPGLDRWVEVLASDPHQADGQREIFISGDNHDAKTAVRALFQDASFAVIDSATSPAAVLCSRFTTRSPALT